MTQKKRRDTGDSASSAPDFDPAKLRYRRDGWTPERQVAFIRALTECGCVIEACRRVGMTRSSAYALYRHPGAASFRRAWDEAVAGAARRRAPIMPLGALAGHYAILPAAAALAEGSWQASTSSTLSTSGPSPDLGPFPIALPDAAVVERRAAALPGSFIRISRSIRWRARRPESGR